MVDNGLVTVEGAVRATSLAFPKQLLSEDSPFYEDASWKDRYDDFTTVNQSKKLDLNYIVHDLMILK